MPEYQLCDLCRGQGWFRDHEDACYRTYYGCTGCGGIQRECTDCTHGLIPVDGT